MIEKRAYTEESTPEEIKAIQSRSWMYKDKIIWVNELPILSPFSININFDRMDQLSKDIGPYALIIDLRGSDRPDAKTRRVVNQRFMKLKDRQIHCAYITGKNSLINAAIKFVMYGMGHSSYSVNSTEAQAIRKAELHLKNIAYELQPR